MGGLAIQWRRSAPLGTLVLGVLYIVLTLFWIAPVVRAPLVYDHWGDFFEALSIFLGALIAYASFAANEPLRARAVATVATAGRMGFGICAVSFAVVQAIHMDVTAGLVPAWMPAGPVFWARLTTIAFALAAIAIVSGRRALLAARLLTAMLLLFEFLVWVPTVLAHPHDHFDWSESIETLAIAAVSWMLADYLTARFSYTQQI